jgi:hypothetical protein
MATQHTWEGQQNRAAALWFQISMAGTVIQQGVYGSANRDFFYPAVMPNSNGDMAMVFARSSNSEFGSLYYTGRCASDPLGKLKASVKVIDGTAFYGGNRWGDYFAASTDPADILAVWVHGQYAGATNWMTRIAKTRF